MMYKNRNSSSLKLWFYQREVQLAIKTGSIHNFFLKCALSVVIYRPFLCMLVFAFVVVQCFCCSVFFPLKFMCITQFWVCYPDLFLINRIMTIEQRYTTFAFKDCFHISLKKIITVTCTFLKINKGNQKTKWVLLTYCIDSRF